MSGGESRFASRDYLARGNRLRDGARAFIESIDLSTACAWERFDEEEREEAGGGDATTALSRLTLGVALHQAPLTRRSSITLKRLLREKIDGGGKR